MYELLLFTGVAGFTQNDEDLKKLIYILGGNFLGCFIAAFIFSATEPTSQLEFIKTCLSNREIHGLRDCIRNFAKAIGCGFIMTTAVKFARFSKENNNFAYILPLILGVPLFLISGFYHSVVDAFYINFSLLLTDDITRVEPILRQFLAWLVVVMGNLLGCNLQRIIMFKKEI